MAFTLSQEKEQIVERLLARYPTKRAACLPLLHLCQREAGWIAGDVVGYVADRLEMSTSEVTGVVTFYTLYHQQPVAPNVLWVCRTLSCDLRGAKTIQEHLEKRLGCHAGQTSKDGKVTLKKAECLAACGNAPMIQLNDVFHENLTIESIDEILDGLGVAPLPKPVAPAPPPVVAVPSPAPAPASTETEDEEEEEDEEEDDDDDEEEEEDDEGGEDDEDDESEEE